MSEHSGDHGSDPPDRHDDSRDEPDSGHEWREQDPLGDAHEPIAGDPEHLGLGDEHGFHEAARGEHLPVHEHQGDAETGHAARRSDAQTALGSPGGTMFELVPDSEPCWLAAHDGRLGLPGASYAASWAADDGTGLSAAIGRALSGGRGP
jgi:hypothetical protein